MTQNEDNVKKMFENDKVASIVEKYEKEKLEREQEIKAALAEESAAQEEADGGEASVLHEGGEGQSEDPTSSKELDETSIGDSKSEE